MNLDKVTVELRPRSEWEAAELGARMTRRDAAAIYRVWFTLTAPAILLVVLASLYTSWGSLALLLYWWLEPVTDGPILRLISRHLFGESPDATSALKSTWSTAWRNRIYWLSPYRLHFARSAILPITQLEGLTGSRRRERARTIGRRVFSHGAGVTAVYQHLLLVVILGFAGLAFALIPESHRATLGNDLLDMLMDQDGRIAMVVNVLLFYTAQTLLHPWWVGAGFGLYINCRTRLEAWDIEVAFRRMAQRRSAAMLLLALFVAAPFAADAQEPATSADAGELTGYWEEDEVRESLERVFEEPELDVWESTTEWQRINKAAPRARSSVPGWLQSLEDIANAVAALFEFGLWIALGLVLVLVFLTRHRWLPLLRGAVEVKPYTPRVMLADGEVTQESLPDDLPAAVRSLWAAGQHREALSLLYRAAVFRSVARYGIRLPDSATELGCLRAVKASANEADGAFFARIVEAWSVCAYAARSVDDSVVQAFCDDWATHYGAEP